jgi:hypothetical protein
MTEDAVLLEILAWIEQASGAALARRSDDNPTDTIPAG